MVVTTHEAIFPNLSFADFACRLPDQDLEKSYITYQTFLLANTATKALSPREYSVFSALLFNTPIDEYSNVENISPKTAYASLSRAHNRLRWTYIGLSSPQKFP